jgi:hypothetical protein
MTQAEFQRLQDQAAGFDDLTPADADLH